MIRPRWISVVAALLLVVLSPRAGAAAAGDPAPFGAFLTPATTVTEADSVVEITFEVDSAAMSFNAYEVTLEFDPTIVAYESVSEGALMTSACANRFKIVSQTASSVTYGHSLLCAGVAVDGPGELSRFRFLALAPGVTEIRITSPDTCTFLDAGICVSPAHPSLPRQVTLTGAFIAVGGDPTSAGPRPDVAGGPMVTVLPNPARERATFRVLVPSAGPALLEVADIGGRRVFSRAWSAGGSAENVPWATGRLPAGTYFVRLRAGGEAVTTRVVLLR